MPFLRDKLFGVTAATFLFVYYPVQGIQFEKTEGSLRIEENIINYEINISKGDYSSDWIEAKLQDTSKKAVEFAEDMKFPTKECRSVSKLGIYTISMDALNDRRRFNRWVKRSESDKIYALFDQIPDIEDSAAILLTDHDEYNSTLFAHEVYHYWSYRFCWDIYRPENDEELMARKFERYYEESR